MKNDLTPIYKKYKGLWVATLKDWSVVGSGKTLKEARQEAEHKGYSETYAMYVPEKTLNFVGAF
ncbi:MAG TPA: DUF5678 domain-containing protein [Candidatus Paceibacterota bacterium]